MRKQGEEKLSRRIGDLSAKRDEHHSGRAAQCRVVHRQCNIRTPIGGRRSRSCNRRPAITSSAARLADTEQLPWASPFSYMPNRVRPTASTASAGPMSSTCAAP
jgi:hypothetical protein